MYAPISIQWGMECGLHAPNSKQGKVNVCTYQYSQAWNVCTYQYTVGIGNACTYQYRVGHICTYQYTIEGNVCTYQYTVM